MYIIYYILYILTFLHNNKMFQLPDSIQCHIFQWDSTFHLLFRQCLDELENKISKLLSRIYLDPSISRTTGYFQFQYIMNKRPHRVFIQEETLRRHKHKNYYRRYKLVDWETTKGTRIIYYLYV